MSASKGGSLVMRYRSIPSMLAFLAMLLSGQIGSLAQSSVNIFGNTVPKTPVNSDGNAVTLGVNFTSTQAGKITGVRFYRGQGNSHGYTVALYERHGKQLALASHAQDTCTVPCWEQISFLAPVSINVNTRYVAAYYTRLPCWEQISFLAPVSINVNTRYVAAYYTSNGAYAD